MMAIAAAKHAAYWLTALTIPAPRSVPTRNAGPRSTLREAQ